MPIIEKSFPQRSDEWHKARLGNPGASEMSKIITSQGKQSTSKRDYLFQLASEKVRGKMEETYQSQAMIDGQERETDARSLFELINDVEVEQCAMVYKDNSKSFHASVDGLIGDDEGLEIKCPVGKTQAKYLYENRLPPTYFVQVQSSLYICERKYWWFMSYVEGMRPLIIRVDRDETFIALLETELKKFCKELISVTEKVR